MNDEQTDQKDLTIKLDGVNYSVVAEYFYSDEYVYGSDADGNRGELRRDLEECHIVNAFDEEGNEVKNEGVLTKLTRLAEREA